MAKKINLKEVLKKAAGTLVYTGLKNFALKNFVKDTTTRNLISTGADVIVGFTNVVPNKLKPYISQEFLQIKTGVNVLRTVMETNKMTAPYVPYIQGEEPSLINGEGDELDEYGMQQETGEDIEGEDAYEMGSEFNEVDVDVNGDVRVNNMQGEDTSLINN